MERLSNVMKLMPVSYCYDVAKGLSGHSAARPWRKSHASFDVICILNVTCKKFSQSLLQFVRRNYRLHITI
jgi:hypothetical protein